MNFIVKYTKTIIFSKKVSWVLDSILKKLYIKSCPLRDSPVTLHKLVLVEFIHLRAKSADTGKIVLQSHSNKIK